MTNNDQASLESTLESPVESPFKVFTITMHFRITDRSSFEQALDDLYAAGVWGEDEGPHENTVEENLEILVKHLDVLATYREEAAVHFEDVGLLQMTNEEVT